MRFSKIKCMKSRGNEEGKESEPRREKRGIPLMPYFVDRRSSSAFVGASTTSPACSRNRS